MWVRYYGDFDVISQPKLQIFQKKSRDSLPRREQAYFQNRVGPRPGPADGGCCAAYHRARHSLPQVKNAFGVTRANFLDSLYADRLAIQTRQAA